MPVPFDQQAYCANTSGGIIYVGKGTLASVAPFDFTIGFWMQLREYPQSPKALIVGTGTSIFLSVTNFGELQLYSSPFTTGAGPFSSRPSVPVIKPMRWHYLHMAATPTAVNVWVDGVPVPLPAGDNPWRANYVAFPIFLGAPQPGNPRETYGAANLDVTDLRIWSESRLDQQPQLDRYLIATDPQLDPSLALYADFSGAATNLRKSPLPSAAISLEGAASIVPLGLPCDESAVVQLFSGDYDCATQSQVSGAWTPLAAPLTIEANNQLSYSFLGILGSIVDCDGVHWNQGLPGGPFVAGSAWVLPRSGHSEFWGAARQPRPCLEGVVSDDGKTLTRFRGVLKPRLSPRFFLCQGSFFSQGNVFLSAGPNATVTGSSAYVFDAASSKNWWQLGDDGTLWNEASGLVLTATGLPGVIPSLSLAPWSSEATQWAFGNDGSISPKGYPNAITLASGGGSVSLPPKANPPLPAQVWISSGTAMQLYDDQGRVLTNSGSTVQTVAALDSPGNNYWYFAQNVLYSSIDGRVLGAATAANGAVIGLQARALGQDALQKWIWSGTRLKLASNPALAVAVSPDHSLTVSTATTGPGLDWSTDGSTAPAPAVSPAPQARSPVAGDVPRPDDFITTDYVITVQTSGDSLAGTGSGAWITLKAGSAEALTIVEQDFPAGSKRTINVTSGGLNGAQVDAISLREGTGFFPEWVVEWVEVYDKTRRTVARVDVKNRPVGYRTFGVTSITQAGSPLTLNWFPGNSVPGTDCSLPRWIDHTYLLLNVAPGDTTSFNCAGNVTPCAGDTVTPNVLTTTVVVDRLIRMATGANEARRAAYGQNLEPNENANVAARGVTNRSGFCHQIANRLLHVGSPRKSLSDLDIWPRGYTLGCLLFGRYGSGFADWCSENGFDVPTTETTSRLACIQELLGDVPRDVQEYVAARMAYYASRYIDTPNYAPHGSGVAAWRDWLASDNATDDAGLTGTQIDRLFKDEL